MRLTYRYRIKDKHAKRLNSQAQAINLIWNYCNETQMKAARDGRKWLSGYDLDKLVAGVTKAPPPRQDAIGVFVTSEGATASVTYTGPSNFAGLVSCCAPNGTIIQARVQTTASGNGNATNGNAIIDASGTMSGIATTGQFQGLTAVAAGTGNALVDYGKNGPGTITVQGQNAAGIFA